MNKFIRDFIEYSGIDSCPYDNLTNFKEITLENTSCLTEDKDAIVELLKVKVIGILDSYEIVQTPDFKILLSGTVKVTYEYMANNLTQTVNSTRTNIEFNDFVLLPKDFNLNTIILPMVSIKDISSKITTAQCVYSNIVLILAVENC